MSPVVSPVKNTSKFDDVQLKATFSYITIYILYCPQCPQLSPVVLSHIVKKVMKIWMLKSDFKAFEGSKHVNIVILRLKLRLDTKK